MKIAVTGRPGIGKTTLCIRVYERLKDAKSISGFITREVREGGRRVGFKLVNLETGAESWLARVGEGKVRVGRYAVDVASFENFLSTVDINSELVIIDEVGPMELKSRRFVGFMERAMERDNLLVTIHYKSKHWLVEKIKKEFKLYVLDEENRDFLVGKIAEDLK